MKYSVQLKMVGCFFVDVEADSRQEAEEKAEADVYASDWNEMSFVEVTVIDSEESEP